MKEYYFIIVSSLTPVTSNDSLRFLYPCDIINNNDRKDILDRVGQTFDVFTILNPYRAIWNFESDDFGTKYHISNVLIYKTNAY